MTRDENGDPATGLRRARVRHGVVLGSVVSAVCVAAVAAVVAGSVRPGDRPAARAPTRVPVTEVAAPAPTDGEGSAPQSRDDALRDQLAADPAVRWAMLLREPRGTMLCGIRVLGSNASDTRLFVWLACGDFATGPDATLLSGTSEPALVAVSGRGAGIEVTGVEFPRQQSFDSDLTRMFPPRIAEVMRTGDIEVTPTLDELLEQARSNLD